MRRCLGLFVGLIACGTSGSAPDSGLPRGWARIADLPEPVSNNAIAAVADGTACTLVTATGIDESRAAAGIHARAWMFREAWEPLPDLPGDVRIAASAVPLRGKVYVLGGYRVAANGSETTDASVDVLDLTTRTWSSGPELPTPIDDAVAVAWRDRWIVVVSGWSNTASVGDVQIFDADTSTWSAATAFPGMPVFGHVGAIAGDDLVILDGVATTNLGGFRLVAQTWHARLEPGAPTSVAWTRLADHPGPARYRAAGGTQAGRLLFHGGTAEPYNFDGLTYSGAKPATPLDDTLAFDPALAAWVEPPPAKPAATMDHRGLVSCGDRLYTIGGMEAGPRVTNAVWQLSP